MTQPQVRIGGDAIVGARDEQQDAFAAGVATLSTGRSAQLAVVVDGMGGHAGGAIAANLALAAFVRAAEAGRWATYPETLRQALAIANQAIASRVDAEPKYRGMGCTLVAAVFDNENLWTISVGDSLLLRVAPNALERMNADHSMAPLAEGATAMDGGNHQRHLLRSALTGGAIALIDEQRFALAGTTRIVLASDGLLTLTPDAILHILLGVREQAPERQARALLDAVTAEAQPDQDNCTVIVVECRTTATAPRGWLRPILGIGLLLAGIGAIAYAWLGAERDPVAAPAALPDRAAPTGTGVTETSRRAGYPLPPVVGEPAAEGQIAPARTPAREEDAKPAPKSERGQLMPNVMDLLKGDEAVTGRATPTPPAPTATAKPSSSPTPTATPTATPKPQK